MYYFKLITEHPGVVLPPFFEVTKDDSTVGRQEGTVDITLRSPLMSRKHCTIKRTPTPNGDFTFSIIDHNSTNKTLINGVILQGEMIYNINIGDKITFGQGGAEAPITYVFERKTVAQFPNYAYPQPQYQTPQYFIPPGNQFHTPQHATPIVFNPLIYANQPGINQPIHPQDPSHYHSNQYIYPPHHHHTPQSLPEGGYNLPVNYQQPPQQFYQPVPQQPQFPPNNPQKQPPPPTRQPSATSQPITKNNQPNQPQIAQITPQNVPSSRPLSSDKQNEQQAPPKQPIKRNENPRMKNNSSPPNLDDNNEEKQVKKIVPSMRRAQTSVAANPVKLADIKDSSQSAKGFSMSQSGNDPNNSLMNLFNREAPVKSKAPTRERKIKVKDMNLFEKPGSSKIQPEEKNRKFDEEFCKTGSVKELDKLIASGLSKDLIIPGSTKSSFALSIEANNLQLAMRILTLQDGVADLSNCSLTEVPTSLLRMIKANLITKLDLRNNRLNEIPLELASFPDVKISKNPLSTIPAQYRDEKWPILRKYVQSAVTIADNWDIRKVIIVGEERSGKTSVLKCIERESKIDCSKRIENEDIELKTVKIEKLNFQFWNLGAALVSKPIHKIFLRSFIYVICFDLSNINYAQLEYWLKNIKSKSMNSIALVVLVGTRSETITDDETNDLIDEIRLKFPKHVFPQVQDIIPVSCKTYAGFPKLRKTLKTVGSHSAFSTDSVSTSYVQLHMKIKGLVDSGKYFLTYDEYEIRAKSSGINSEVDLKKASQFLNDFGTILYYDHPKSRNFVFFHPKALLEFFNFVNYLSNGTVNWDTPGLISETDLPVVFRGYPQELRGGISAELTLCLQNILQKYKVIYHLFNLKSYFIPSILPKLKPTFANIFPVRLPDEEVCYGRLFQFKQLPLELFERVLSSTINFPQVKVLHIWENGILVIHRDVVLVSIEYFPMSYKLMLELRFKRETNNEKIALSYWRQLLEMMRTQVESWCSSLSWSEKVPCVHCMKMGVSRDIVYLIDYQTVLDSTSPIIYCHNIQSSTRCIDKIEVAPDISLMDLPQINENKLQVGEQIGEGGFGKVYKGTFNGSLIAIKELTIKDENISGELFKAFQTEVYAQCLLDHENCVKLYGVTANPPRMILEFISGGDLYHFLHPKRTDPPTQNSFAWKTRWDIAFDIAKGLHHMQSVNPPIIHRDLRSPNIFLTNEGRAVIGDFGLSRLVNPEVGGMLATWQWLAPECIDSKDLDGYDHRADIYSYGIILWELASLDLPFEEYASNPLYFQNGNFKLQELKRAIIDEGLRPTIPKNTPQNFAEIIKSCWDSDSLKRPNTSEILTKISIATNNQLELKRQLNYPLPGPIDARLGSHLHRYIAPTLRHEQPLHTFNSPDYYGTSRRFIFIQNQIWLATSKGFIAVYEIDDNQIKFKYEWKAHDGRVASLISTHGRVWSCSDDDLYIRIWNTEFQLVEAWKPAADVSRGKGPCHMIQADYPTVRIWCAFPSESMINVLNIHTHAVEHSFIDPQLFGMSSLVYHNNNIWIANQGNIIMYDTNYNFIGSFIAHDQKAPTHLLSIGDNVWTASSNELKIWSAASIETLNLAAIKYIGDAKIECIQSSSTKVYIGYYNGEIVMWNANNLQAEQEVIPSNYSIKCIIEYNGKLLAASSSFEIFLYNSSYLHPKPAPTRSHVPIKSIGRPKSATSVGQNNQLIDARAHRKSINEGGEKEKGEKGVSDVSKRPQRGNSNAPLPPPRKAKSSSSSNPNLIRDNNTTPPSLPVYSIDNNNNNNNNNNDNSNNNNDFIDYKEGSIEKISKLEIGMSPKVAMRTSSRIHDDDVTSDGAFSHTTFRLKLADPNLKTLRKKNMGNSAETSMKIQILGRKGQILPYDCEINPDITVDQLYSSVIPSYFLKLGQFQEGRYFELLWFKSEDSAARFTSYDLNQSVGPFILRFSKLQLNLLPSENLEKVLVNEGIQLYGKLDSPSARSGLVLIR